MHDTLREGSPNQTNGAADFQTIVLGADFNNVIDFRVEVMNPTGTHALAYDNIEIGDPVTTVIPEPATLGLVALAGRARRKRR